MTIIITSALITKEVSAEVIALYISVCPWTILFISCSSIVFPSCVDNNTWLNYGFGIPDDHMLDIFVDNTKNRILVLSSTHLSTRCSWWVMWSPSVICLLTIFFNFLKHLSQSIIYGPTYYWEHETWPDFGLVYCSMLSLTVSKTNAGVILFYKYPFTLNAMSCVMIRMNFFLFKAM